MPKEDALRQLLDLIGQAQAINKANSYILMEIVRDIARSKPDSHKYLAEMFERISARADQSPVEREAHPVQAEFRLAISTFFSLAQKGL